MLAVEPPYLSTKEIDDVVHHGMDMHHIYPDKFKSTALARGDEYLPSYMEESKEEVLDSVQLD